MAEHLGMSLKAIIPGVPCLRNSADEVTDRAETAFNLISHCFLQWPNAAGFDAPEEHLGPERLKTQGKIPAWCAGTLFRTGPGLSQIETKKKGTYRVSHWFDGFAHSHRFDIQALPPRSPGDAAVTVTYRSRRQAEELMDHIRESGTYAGVTFAQRADPCIGLLGKCVALFNRPTGYNIHVVVNPNLPDFEHTNEYALPAPARAGHRAAAQNLWLTTDASVALEVDPNTLEPIGLAHQSELHGDLSGPLSAAHGQRDPDTGDLFNFNTSIGYTATHRVFRLRADTGNTEILATIRDGHPVPAPASYVHSIFLTRNFVVVCLPVTRFRKAGLQIPLEKNILDAIAPFDENDVCRWFVVDRRHGRGLIARFETPAAFFFHSVNAFEERQDDGSVMVYADVVEYPNHDIMHAFYYDMLLNRNSAAERFYSPGTAYPYSVQPQLVRWRAHLGHPERPISPSNGMMVPADAVVRILGPHVGELPTINSDYASRRTRFVYSGAARGLGGAMMDSIVKTDMEERTALFWTGPTGHSPGEPIFVTRPAGSGGTGDEDDGALLSVVLNGHTNSSYLLCLDAKTLKELGRAECGFAVPFGFHGAHVMPA